MPALVDRSPEIIRRLRSTTTSGSTTPSCSFLVGRHHRPAALRDDVWNTGRSPARYRRPSAARRSAGWTRPCRPRLARASNVSSQLPRRAGFQDIADHVLRAGGAGKIVVAARAPATGEEGTAAGIGRHQEHSSRHLAPVWTMSADLRSAIVNNWPTMQAKTRHTHLRIRQHPRAVRFGAATQYRRQPSRYPFSPEYGSSMTRAMHEAVKTAKSGRVPCGRGH